MKEISHILHAGQEKFEKFFGKMSSFKIDKEREKLFHMKSWVGERNENKSLAYDDALWWKYRQVKDYHTCKGGILKLK